MNVVLAVLIATVSVASLAQSRDITDRMPKVINGRVVDPNAVPPATPNYPRLDRQSGETRLQINRDVSVGGDVTRDSVSGNVRFPLPEKKKR